MKDQDDVEGVDDVEGDEGVDSKVVDDEGVDDVGRYD